MGTSADGMPLATPALKGQLTSLTPLQVKPLEVPLFEPAVAGATEAKRSAYLHSSRHVTKPPLENPVRWFFFRSVRKTSATFLMMVTMVASSWTRHVPPGSAPGHGGPVGATTTNLRDLRAGGSIEASVVVVRRA